jgi:4-amino-4-deoxy-L-arabinose transferase-like glycosyltransferase
MSQHPGKSETAWFLAALGFLILISFFLGLGSAPLFDVDEGAFSEATREMMISKNYLTPYLNGAPRFDKPILFYWVQLLCVKLFGINEFAFRLPSALAGTAWATSIFLFVRKESGNRQALLASAIMVLSLQVVVITKAAIADGVLNCFLAITMFSLLNHFKTGSKRSLYITFATAGFGMLTKGPIAILIPAAVSFLFAIEEGSFKKWIGMIFNPIGLLLFICIALPWYLLEYRDQGMAFIEGFFVRENLSRFNTSFEGHSGSVLYYIPVLIVGMMPFTGLLFTVIFNIKKLLSDRTNRFLLIWFVFVFVFFSLSGTKLPHYIIYGYTPLFILMARALTLSKHSERFAAFPMLFFALLASLPYLLHIALQKIDDDFFRAILIGGTELTGRHHTLIMIAAILCIAAIQLIPLLSPAGKLISTGVVFSFCITIHLMPLAGNLMQMPVKEAGLLAKKEGYKTVMWEVYNPSYFVYSESLAESRTPKRGEIVLTTVKELKHFQNTTVLYSRYGIVLAKLKQ